MLRIFGCKQTKPALRQEIGNMRTIGALIANAVDVQFQKPSCSV